MKTTLFSVASLFCTAALASAAGNANIPSSWVNIVSVSSSKCLDMPASSTVPGTAVEQWTCNGGDNQKFQLTPVSGGYEITVKNSALQLDVAGGPSATQNGASIIQWPFWGGTNETWSAVQNADGSYLLKPV